MAILILLSASAAGLRNPRDGLGGPPSTEVGPVRPADQFHYVGNKKCRMCHDPWYESWLASPKAGAFDALKPGAKPEVKHRAGLSITEDYTTDERCLSCHAVGLGSPGGYIVVDDRDTHAARHAQTREGVGCESCHGPGSAYIEIMREIARSERPYHPAELRAAGRRPVGPEVCARCHNDDAVCMAGRTDRDWMNVDISNHDGFHESIPLRYRIHHSKEAGSRYSPHPSVPDPPTATMPEE